MPNWGARRRTGSPETRKYGNRKVKIGEFLFDSQAEADRYLLLKEQYDRGEIFNLCVKPAFPLIVNGIKITARPFHPDFAYTTKSYPGLDLRDPEWVQSHLQVSSNYAQYLRYDLRVEDTKGYMDAADDATRRFHVNRNLVLAIYGITIDIIQTDAAVRSQERRKAKRKSDDALKRLVRKGM